MIRVNLPKPEIRGVGHVWYRCATCSELMEPEDALLVEGRSYHPDHAPGAPLWQPTQDSPTPPPQPPQTP